MGDPEGRRPLLAGPGTYSEEGGGSEMSASESFWSGVFTTSYEVTANVGRRSDPELILACGPLGAVLITRWGVGGGFAGG